MGLFQNDSGNYEYLSHYTNMSALQHILLDKTLKCNSFKNLNDLYERNRRGIEKIVEAHFTACFCHASYEIVPFWYMYGGKKEEYKDRVMLRFRNFSYALDKFIEADYALGYDEKFEETKINFNPDLNANIQHKKEEQVIGRIKMLDVEYLDIYNPFLKKEYAKFGNVHIYEMENSEKLFSFPVQYDIGSIGKYKTESWGYEQETRILVRMTPTHIRFFEFILLRMREEIFRDLTIVANPWASDDFINKVKYLVETCNISNDIKNSIKIEKSILYNQLIEPQ